MSLDHEEMTDRIILIPAEGPTHEVLAGDLGHVTYPLLGKDLFT